MASVLERSELLRAICRHRWLVLGVAAVCSALLEVQTSGPSNDGWYFAAAGRRLLSSTGLHVYASNGLQAGPLQLASFGALAHLATWLHLPLDGTYAVISTLASTAVIVGGVRLLRRHVGLADSAVAELLAGTFAVGWLLAAEVYLSGHPAELVIPALWIAAGVLAADDRPAWAGALVGLGAGFETWAVLGVPVLLLATRWSRRALAAGVAAMVSAAWFVPFVVAGPFRMGQLHWNVASTSLVHALDPGLTEFPWSARLAQAIVVVSLGSLAWAGIRRWSDPSAGVWLVPAVIAVTKAVTESAGYDWYWLPAQLTLLVGCACADGLPRRVLGVAVIAEVTLITDPLQRWQFAVAVLTALLVVAWAPRGARPPRRIGTLRSTG
jgi:hypothetical protein